MPQERTENTHKTRTGHGTYTRGDEAVATSGSLSLYGQRKRNSGRSAGQATRRAREASKQYHGKISAKEIRLFSQLVSVKLRKACGDTSSGLAHAQVWN